MRASTPASTAQPVGASVCWFGRGERAEVRAVDVEVTATGTVAAIVVDGEARTLRLRVLGEHHVMNALAALAAATSFGVDLDAAIARLEAVELAERWRMQPLGGDRVRIINDAYNASPDSMAAALRTLAQITARDERMVAVLGAMSELGEYAGEEHDRVGLLAVRLGVPRTPARARRSVLSRTPRTRAA